MGPSVIFFIAFFLLKLIFLGFVLGRLFDFLALRLAECLERL